MGGKMGKQEKVSPAKPKIEVPANPPRNTNRSSMGIGAPDFGIYT